jgi:hypothetical protein
MIRRDPRDPSEARFDGRLYNRHVMKTESIA